MKPDTSRKERASKGEKLDRKGVAISLFFGLTIGFGTGFVGTGGGMMMLVVFTAFLGMELKTAVGTSTFIMTFTALIASVSHILIHPAILLEKWEVMLLCIIVVTAASLVSARFANRVSNRTVGLVTGAVLTVLGGSMLLLNFWMVWGFTNPRGGSPIVNCRTETAGSKQFWQDSWRQRRCIIPASYYFEWSSEYRTDGTKQKYLLQPKDSNITFLAGLYRIEERNGLQIPVFTVLTRVPGESIRFIHDRMPVILPVERIRDWIAPDSNPEQVARAAMTEIYFEKG